MARLRLSLVFPFLLLVPVPVLAQYGPYDYGFDVGSHVKRQFSSRRVVVQTESDDGEIHVRQEIRQLEKDPELWTLYILALSMMQFTDQDVPTSWYGITGIHGIPYQTWNGVEPLPGNERYGYCFHSSVLFPTWHRPYMALYEQVLRNLAQYIASLWPEPDRKRFERAARRFRIPYWDWAASPPSAGSVFPASIGALPFVDVTGPNGRQRIANPLYSYSFRPLNKTAFSRAPWNYWTNTLRYPTSSAPDAQSNNSQAAINFDRNRPSIAQRLYALLSNYDDYNKFSNNAWRPQSPNASYDSLESLHDTVHSLSGGIIQGRSPGGHMSYIPFSAFDPIFFLHHAMVDRIFAIWQTLYPDSWVKPTPAREPTYTHKAGQIQNASTPLTPFFANDNGTFWTSDGVRDHTIFGYTYAELVKQRPITSRNAQQAYQARVKAAVNRLYGTNSPATLFMNELRAQGFKEVGVVDGQINDKLFASTLGGRIFDGDHYHEWTINIRVGKMALGGPFSIHFFLGDPPADPDSWTISPKHVGTMGVFGHADKEDAPRIRRRNLDADFSEEDGITISGTVPLTAALVKEVIKGELASLAPQHVESYLATRLQKRVLAPGGKVFTVECVRGLKISVVSSVVRAPYSEDELPEWKPGANMHMEMC